MSLATFHVVFVSLSAVMSAFCGVWAWQQFQSSGDGVLIAGALGGLIGTLALVAYGWFRYRKLKILTSTRITFSAN